jgi:hypothetical protein
MKIEMLEAVLAVVAETPGSATILCGDFNVPQMEMADGRIITWAEDIVDGEPRVMRSWRADLGSDGTPPNGASWRAEPVDTLLTLIDIFTVTVARSPAGLSSERNNALVVASITRSAHGPCAYGSASTFTASGSRG